MTVLWDAFYFIVALGILVTFHEFGHFWVARKLGVKVLKFSVGFGKPIWQRTAKDGVNYIIASIPLGGYVKMLDEREGEVPPEESAYAFNNKSVWARMAIVLAGPVANFILAVFFYWMIFIMGIGGFSTEMGEIAPDSIAGRAGLTIGDKITKVDGEPVLLEQDMVTALARRIGDKTEIQLEVEKVGNHQLKTLKLDISGWELDTDRPDILGSLGIRHKTDDPEFSVGIATVAKGSSADKGGIKPADLIKGYDGETIKSWSDLVSRIRSQPGEQVNILIERDGELREISVVIGSQQQDGQEIGLLGVLPDHFKTRKGGVGESFNLAIHETGKMISLTMQLFKKLLVGDISPKSLSGPLSIAEGAGGSARGGLVYFLSFVAMISVNLGFINLLPIPLLDGGHLLFFSIEAIKGKPLSEKVQEIGMQIGMLMVFALMAIAIFNDLSRL